MSVKILVAGDMCPQQRVGDLFENEDFQSVLGDVKSVLSEADYSIVNFECPVVNGKGTPIQKQGPNLHCTEKGIEAVKWLGFDCVTLANNHFLDYGEEGVKNTLAACKKSGLDTVGGGINLKDAEQTLYKEIKGQTIAIINCCEHEFSIATDKTAGSNPLNPIRQYYSIKEARTKADYVIIIVHGGHEHFQLPSPRMQETYRFFIDAGADAVVNHHQHCFSGYEVYKEKPIFYGLGNFCFDNASLRKGKWTEGYMVEINFDSSIVSFSLHPYIQCAAVPKVRLLDAHSFNAKIESINAIITNKETLKIELNSYYDSCGYHCSEFLEPIKSRYYLGARRRGWLPSLISKRWLLSAANSIQCESHRDVLIRWFDVKKK